MNIKYKIKLGKLLESAPGVLMYIIGINLAMLAVLGFVYVIIESVVGP